MRFMPTQGAVMNPSISSRFVAAAALAMAALGATSAAQARSNVYFSVALQGAPVYVEPAPVYMQPQPVYIQPRPVYVQPPVYAAPAQAYGERPCPPAYASSYEDEQAWRRAEWHRRHWKHRHHDWDQYPSRGHWDD
jgi:hypothetical protein